MTQGYPENLLQPIETILFKYTHFFPMTQDGDDVTIVYKPDLNMQNSESVMLTLFEFTRFLSKIGFEEDLVTEGILRGLYVLSRNGQEYSLYDFLDSIVEEYSSFEEDYAESQEEQRHEDHGIHNVIDNLSKNNPIKITNKIESKKEFMEEINKDEKFSDFMYHLFKVERGDI